MTRWPIYTITATLLFIMAWAALSPIYVERMLYGDRFNVENSGGVNHD